MDQKLPFSLSRGGLPCARRHFLTALVTLAFTISLAGCDWATIMGGEQDEEDNGGEQLDPVISQVTGFEPGVSNLNMSLPVYTDGLGMEVINETETGTSLRVTLASPASPFDTTLTLIEFTDGLGRNLQDNPGKLVFYGPDVEAMASSFDIAGGVITLPPEQQGDLGVVGFGRDPDNNLIEFVESPTSAGVFMAAVGIGVSDLEDARDFYNERVGLTELMFLETERYDEYIMGNPNRPDLSLVLMHWTDDVERSYRGNETRIRLVSEDPREITDRTYSEEDGRIQDLDGNRLIIGEDPVNLGGAPNQDDSDDENADTTDP